MLVGWIILMVQKMSVNREWVQNTSLLIAGIVSFGLIVAVLVMFVIFLVREIIEVRRQTSFVDSVTHELKSPLASLKLCLETLARPEVGDTQRATLRQMMLDDVERLSTFIDDVLEASRITHGRGGSHILADIALAELTHDVAEAVAKRYKLGVESIDIAIPSDLRLRTDRTALETILKNLLDNAVKYSDPPIRVGVRATPTRGSVKVEVHDHGIGIGEADLKRVFERFYRVPIEAVRARHGTGLGLFVVSALTRSIGGRLDARSGGVGKGTSMIITLPLDTKDAVRD
jgi:signal transduction histidine kinase